MSIGQKYKAYPEYKDSGLEWLGDVPKHWSIEYSKWLFPESKERAHESAQQLSATQDYGVISQAKFMRLAGRRVVQLNSNQHLRKKVQVDDFVISMRSFQGGLERAWEAGGIRSSYVVLRPRNDLVLDYYQYLFKSTDYIQALQSTANFIRDGQDMNYQNFILIDIPLPPEDEKRNIATLLNHEVTRIDTLIEEQQSLIKLLQEKRQAVISHAVTRGLNPDAPMKDSGVEWLGDVPEHWFVAQLKFNTLDMQTGPFGSQLHSEDYVNGGTPLVNPAHMIDGNIIPDPQVSVDNKTWHRLNRHQLSEGEIIFARRGELGRCAIVTKEQEGWLCGTGSLKAKLNHRLLPKYAYLLITSDGVISELSLESKGSTMDNLNTETLGRVRLPVPPTTEQQEILTYVDVVSGKFQDLIKEAVTAIDLMQERRTALISAAVTGKIDVRDWQPPAQAAV